MTTDIYSVLWQQTPLAAFVVGILGLLVGSFLNVVIYRLPVMLHAMWAAQEMPSDTGQNHSPAQPRFNLAWPASHCPACQHPLKARDNIPVLSYLFLLGRCRYCRHPIHWRYPAVELTTAFLSASTVWLMPDFHPVWLLFIWVAIALTAIDLQHQLLPDTLTLPLLWAGLLSAALGWLPVAADQSIMGAIAGYSSLWLLFQVHRWLRGRDGMGYGDFKLLAALGAWLGPLALAPLVFLGALAGLLAASSVRLMTGRMPEALPFGPFLVTGALIVLYVGDPMWAYYLAWARGY